MPSEIEAERRDAYQQGRLDARRHYRRTPLFKLTLFAIAAVGAVVLFYAAREGSFSRGGQVVDAKLGYVTGEVLPNAVNDAADQTGSALKVAGEQLKDKGAAAGGRASN